ncbi:alpha/beta-hydrolase [Violaceomyces palustris]|uniref:Alpha/beta-hydrolase n=1 Tax=Violaceomyces palustris TaxID=1673888 RepID=A0ACD0NWR3_9BASI|nr:alpha/beta-hydrolase [Violaceomyces palustris]
MTSETGWKTTVLRTSGLLISLALLLCLEGPSKSRVKALPLENSERERRQTSNSNLQVNVEGVTYQGSTVDSGVERFLGIPYVETPKRLEPSVRRTWSTSNETTGGGGAVVVVDATGFKPSCPQSPTGGLDINLLYQILYAQNDARAFSDLESFLGLTGSTVGQSEDCLHAAVYRPSGTKEGDDLPVVIWIHGGSFIADDLSNYDQGIRNMVSKSVDLDQKVIYVSINYRLGAFGFLYGPEIKAKGLTNLGLKDQRMAMEWVQDNIGIFGGDPNKVTLHGQSSGAMSVANQLLAYGQTSSKGLFRAAILESGAPMHMVDSSSPNWMFDVMTSSTGCDSSTDKVACLQNVSYQDFQNAEVAVANDARSIGLDLKPTVDGDFIPTSPLAMIDSASYVRDVPLLIGNNDDEGSILALPQATGLINDTSVINFLNARGFSGLSDDQRNELLELYPSDPSQGSPYGTGDDDQMAPRSKQVNSLLGDSLFHSPRRNFMSKSQPGQSPMYGYLFRSGKYINYLGSFHELELIHVFGMTQGGLTDEIMSRWLGFVNQLRPDSAGYPDWPEYQTSGGQILTFQDGATSVDTDNYRAQPISLFSSLAAQGFGP